MENLDQLGLLIKQIHIGGVNKLNREIDKYDMTFSQFVVLQYILKNRDTVIYKKDIEKALKLSHATSNGVLARLHKKQLIDFKTAKDKRFQQVTVTKKGEDVYESLLGVFQAHENFLREDFSPSELKLLINFLQRLLIKTAGSADNPNNDL